MKALDLTGQMFDRWTVLERVENSDKGQTRWRCRCACPEQTIRIIAGDALRSGLRKSCGCLRREVTRARSTTHGASMPGGPHHGEFLIWNNMHYRCNAKHDKTHQENYAKRGIKICERWCGEQGFENFLTDMGPRPSKKHSVERENNMGDYEPTNCVWATRVVQNSNSRRNVALTIDGVTKTTAEWARTSGVSKSLIRYRLQAGWSIKDAVWIPSDKRITGRPS